MREEFSQSNVLESIDLSLTYTTTMRSGGTFRGEFISGRI